MIWLSAFFKTFKVYFVLGAMVIVSGLSGTIGYKLAKSGYAKQLEANLAWYDSTLAETRTASQALSRKVDDSRAIAKLVTEGVIAYVEKNPQLNDCELDADGLRLWNGEAPK